MPVSNDHVTGFAVGIGVAAVGFYLYKTNQRKVDDWLRSQGINVPESPVVDTGSLSLEDLMREKEKLEDLIAEREIAVKKPAAK